MGRKKKSKRIAKSKFRNNICSVCGLCSKSVNPKFCYNFLYKKNPGKFKDQILVNLINQAEWARQIKLSDSVMHTYRWPALAVFRSIFCDGCPSSNCDQTVPRLQACLSKFRQQDNTKSVMQMVRDTLPPKQKKKRNKNKRKKQKPKVTVFMSDNEDFQAEVKRILEDNRRKPDKD